MLTQAAIFKCPKCLELLERRNSLVYHDRTFKPVVVRLWYCRRYGWVRPRERYGHRSEERWE